MAFQDKATFGISMAMMALVVFLLSMHVLSGGASTLVRHSDSAQPVAGNEHNLISQVVVNELRVQRLDHSLWRYKQRKTEDGKTTLCDIVETDHGSLYRIIAINGQPLGPDAVRKEDARVREMVSNPQQLQNEEQKEEHDVGMARQLLQMIPDAFLYHYAGQAGRLTRFSFTPNPSFHPSSREGQVFHHMEGSIWVDGQQKRIARVEGRLASEVKFGGGILGNLAAGGTFSIEQRNVGRSHWELTRLNLEMNGKALLFKTIDLRQQELDFDFRPVSAGITVEEAAQLLDRGVKQRSTQAPGSGAED